METLAAEQKSAQKIIQDLSQLLADTYILYLKTQNFHWNIIDPRFFSLHKMFETQYEELEETVDELAERIRALGHKAPASMKQFLELTSLEEADNDLDANKMLHQLIHDHTAISSTLKPKIPETQKLGDEGTADIYIERVRYHDKTAWMLRSHFIKER